MPGLFFEPNGQTTSRRDFLKVTAAAGAAAVVTGCQSAARMDTRASSGNKFHLALLSDTHIPADQKNGHRGFNPWENLKQVVPQVVEAEPEGVIICGDVARLEGLEADYREARALLEPIAAKTPVVLALGNHDDRANFNKVFLHTPGEKAGIKDKHVVVIEDEVVRIVVLDSLLYVNKVAGLLGKDQRAWLKEFLATKSDKPVALFVHHTLTDNDGDLLDADRMFDLLAPHQHVKAIFFGHSHVWSIAEREGIQLVNLPAVGYNFRDQEPVGWVDARFDERGVDLTLRAIGGNKTDDRRIRRVKWRAA